MSFYKEVPGRKTTLESTLKFDTTPTVGSTNPVTSEGVKGAIDGAVGDASEALQEQIDDIAEKAGSGYIPKGEATVATLNALTGHENGDLYTLTDAGTLTDGTLAVVAGDTVAWNATNSVWYKAMDYAPRQYGTSEIHNLPTSITAFRTGDMIAVDGTSGTAKMSKDDLLRETAENAITNGIAPAWNKNRTGGWKYNELCSYNGKLYVFNADHAQGDDWSGTDVTEITLSSLAVRGRNIIASGSPLTSFNDLPINVVAQIGKNLDDSPDDSRHPWGVVSTLSSNNGDQVVQEFVEFSTNAFYNGRSYKRIKRNNVWSSWSEVADVSKFRRCNTFVGADEDTQYYMLPVMAGGILVISIDDPLWDASNGPTNKFAVSAITENNVITDIAVFTKTSDPGKFLFLHIPADAVAVRIIVRANVGVNVTMQFTMLSNSDIEELIAATITRSENFEIGNITIKPASLTYASSDSRLRTSEQFVLELKKYDVIVCKNGYEIYVGSSSDGNAPFNTAGWITEYTALNDEKVHFVLRRKVEATFDFAEASRAFFVFSSTANATCRYFAEQGQLLNNYWRIEIKGNDNKAVVKRFYPNVGQKLTFVADRSNWSIDNLPSSYTASMMAIRYVKSDNTTSDIVVYRRRMNTILNPTTIVVPNDAVAVELLIRADVGQTILFEVYGTTEPHEDWNVRSFVRGINHRGYSDFAPENTLPAFRLSKINGFGIVETDVRKTSDGVLVCIHDNTVNRTSNGTGYVADFTFEQIRELDFGSWKSAQYAGVKIPSFEEFVSACRTMGLEAFVELKISGITDEVMDLVDAYGMRNHVTLMTTDYSVLEEASENYPSVPLGLAITGADVDATIIAQAQALKTPTNEVAILPNKTHLTDAGIALCKASKIPVIVWGESYGFDTMRESSPVISGFLHNSLNACHIMACQEMCR